MCGIICEIGKVTPQYSFIFKWAMIQSYYEQTTITKEACGSVVCALSYCRHTLLIPNKLVASSG